MPLFNVRVYGLLINNQNEVLVSDEQEYGMRFTKFPGGGLEYGEGDMLQAFRWLKLDTLSADDFTFPIDKYVAKLLIEQK